MDNNHLYLQAKFGVSGASAESLYNTTDHVMRDCADMMADRIFVTSVAQKGFDLAVVDCFFAARCKYTLPISLGIPYVSYSSILPYWVLRLPVLPSVVPLTTSEFSQNMNFNERFRSLFGYMSHFVFSSGVDVSLLHRYIGRNHGFRSWDDVVRNSELFLWNSESVLNVPVPLTPDVVSIGGITTGEGGNLEAELNEFMEQSQEGVVIVSFGSIITYLPDHVLEKFAAAFSKLKQNVIWRCDRSSNIKIPRNVKTLKWLPQNDLLAHSKTRLFITHCGNNGQYEALYHAVPMLAVPMLWDQPYNAQRIKSKGFGDVIDITDFTSVEMATKMKRIIETREYRWSIGNASEVYRKQPQFSHEKASFWMEYVIKFGTRHLHSPSLNMSVAKILMTDIVILVFSIILFFGITVLNIYYCCIHSTRLKLTSKSKIH